MLVYLQGEEIAITDIIIRQFEEDGGSDDDKVERIEHIRRCRVIPRSSIQTQVYNMPPETRRVFSLPPSLHPSTQTFQLATKNNIHVH